MKRLIFLFSLITSFLTGFSQGDVVGGRVIARNAIFLRDRWVDTIKVDTNYLIGNNRSLMSAGAIYEFVTGRIANIQGGGGVINNIYTADGELVGDRTLTGNNNGLIFDDLSAFGVGINSTAGYLLEISSFGSSLFSADRTSQVEITNGRIDLITAEVYISYLAGNGDGKVIVDNAGKLSWAIDTAGSGSGGSPNLIFDSLGIVGISPVTARNDTLFSRRISVVGGLTIDTTASGGIVINASGVAITQIPVSYVIAISDETTAITTGTAKVTFRMPHAMTLTGVRASVNTVSSSGTPTVDINESGSTILSTKLTIDVSEKTSTTAAVPAVISNTSLLDDAEITMDIDVAGTGAKGLKVVLTGTRSL